MKAAAKITRPEQYLAAAPKLKPSELVKEAVRQAK